MNYHQKKLMLIAFIVLWLSIAGIGIYKASATRLDTYTSVSSVSGFIYSTNFLPPRTQQLCYNNFIGVEYNSKYEKRCRVLWDSWTKEILTNNL